MAGVEYPPRTLGLTSRVRLPHHVVIERVTERIIERVCRVILYRWVHPPYHERQRIISDVVGQVVEVNYLLNRYIEIFTSHPF